MGIYQPLLGNCNFQTLSFSSLLRCFVSTSLFTSKTLSLVSRIVFIIAAVTRSYLVSKLRCFLNSCDSLYHSHVHADHFNYSIPRSLGSQSFCYPPSASLVSLSRFIATSFGSLRTFTYGGGMCLRGFSFKICTFTCICFDQCVVSIFEFHVASIQSSTKRKSAFFHVVCTCVL